MPSLPRGDREGFDQIGRRVLAQRLPSRRTDPATHIVFAHKVTITRRRPTSIWILWAWLVERDALAVPILIRAIEEQRQPGVLELEWLLGPVGRIVVHERPIFLDRHHHVGSDALRRRDAAISGGASLRHG